jgi:hypothetical protein
MKITLISDTHNKHKELTKDLPGGDLILHGGDMSSMGYKHEIQQFCKWFSGLNKYTHKIFIAGNHDFGFQDNHDESKEIVNSYGNIEYLQDNMFVIGDDYSKSVKIWGAPWQPEFHNWAFNLPKNGPDLQDKWNMIPMDIDILITHGPANGILDDVSYNRGVHLGCELLRDTVKKIKPKIHICGHIHTGHGYYFDGNTHFFNAAVLDEEYKYTQQPWEIEWNPDTNEIEFLNR